jgi:hypothetical protein
MHTGKSCGGPLALCHSFELPGALQELNRETLVSDDVCATCLRLWMSRLELFALRDEYSKPAPEFGGAN